MITVRLWEHAGTGLIVPRPTGVRYCNQVGGHDCHQVSIEGFFVPIANAAGAPPKHEFCSPENFLFKHFAEHSAMDGLTERDADVIELAFRDVPLWNTLQVDRSRLVDCFEAWVHVTISYDSDSCGIIEGLNRNFGAILTWTNTD
ncbi:DUF6210 family protein [Crateriforma spongiae]|uniref:DUF6210 family protein n=1 Tax=Crateriforma spongiae TaxID=2724528 RepID=UPI0036F23773